MILIDHAKCIGCGACVRDCLNHTIAVRDGHAEILGPCFNCGHCIAICPTEAVSMDTWDMHDVIPLDPATCTVPPDVMLNTIRCRRSIRQFTDERIPRETLEQILEAGRFSLTASNAQSVSYIVFQTERDDLRRISMEEFRKFREPQAFARLFPPPKSPDRVEFDNEDFLFKGGDTVILTLSPAPVDAAIASANMELVANSLGIGMVYVGYFVALVAQSPRLRQWIGLQESDRVVTCLSMGYPAVRYLRSVPRKPLQAVWR